MKVKKHTQVKDRAKSQKWKDVSGKRCRPLIRSSEPSSSPVMMGMIKEHQLSMKKKPSVKRLKHKVKSDADSKKNSPPSTSTKPHAQPNGNSAFTIDNASDDFEEWREYCQSIQGNGMETSCSTEDVRPGRLEGESLHYCAERANRKNRAVLVMQKDQVWFRIFS